MHLAADVAAHARVGPPCAAGARSVPGNASHSRQKTAMSVPAGNGAEPQLGWSTSQSSGSTPAPHSAANPGSAGHVMLMEPPVHGSTGWTKSTHFPSSWNLKSSGRNRDINQKHHGSNDSAIVWSAVSKAVYQEAIYQSGLSKPGQEMGCPGASVRNHNGKDESHHWNVTLKTSHLQNGTSTASPFS